jgi:hypothetical protein
LKILKIISGKRDFKHADLLDIYFKSEPNRGQLDRLQSNSIKVLNFDETPILKNKKVEEQQEKVTELFEYP